MSAALANLAATFRGLDLISTTGTAAHMRTNGDGEGVAQHERAEDHDRLSVAPGRSEVAGETPAALTIPERIEKLRAQAEADQKADPCPADCDKKPTHPACERCHRRHDPSFGGEAIRLEDNDWCSDCNFHVGLEQYGRGELCSCNLLACVQKRGDCWRYLSEADCDVRCCQGCHQEERLGDDRLGAECLTALAEEYAERDREAAWGSECTTACGHCGACS